MRLLILIILVYLGYQLFKKWLLPGRASESLKEDENLSPVDDVMVKDPFCETYFPKRKGVQAVVDGETHYFCSPACRDKFVEKHMNSES